MVSRLNCSIGISLRITNLLLQSIIWQGSILQKVEYLLGDGRAPSGLGSDRVLT